MDPLRTSAIYADINTAFKFAENALGIAEVGTENEVFVRTIQVVRNDLQETQRLLVDSSVFAKVLRTPAKLEWIERAIDSTKKALYEIGKLVERARADHQANGTVKFDTRVRWIFNDHEKLNNRVTELSACHQQLSNILAYLAPLEDPEMSIDPPTFDQVTYFDDMLSPRQKRRQTMDQKKVSAPHRMAYLDNTISDGSRPALGNSSDRKDRAKTLPAIMPSSRHPSAVSITMSDEFGTSLIPTSDAIPASPPPTYTTATQRARPSFPNDYQTTSVIRRRPLVTTRLPPAIAPSNDKSKEVYAYKSPQYAEPQSNDYTESESWSLSGTNHLGPVDPHALVFYEPPGTQVRNAEGPYEIPTEATLEPVEMPGDMTFPVELPTNDPGPPPGYPRPGARVTAPQRPEESVSHTSASYKAFTTTDAMYELPSAPFPTQPWQPSRKPTRYRNTTPWQPSRKPTRYRSTTPPNSFLATNTSSNPSTQLGAQQREHRHRHSYSASTIPLLTSPSMSSISSTSTMPSYPSSLSQNSTAPSYSNPIPTLSSLSLSPPAQQLSSPATPSDSSNRPAPPPRPPAARSQTAASTRMRNQKTHIDLLASISR